MSDEHDPDDVAETACRFTDTELAIYLFLLQGPASLPDCCAATGLEEGEVTRVLENLSQSKLVQPLPIQPPRWRAVAPNLAFLNFLSKLRAEYAKLSRQTTSLNNVLNELQSVMRSDVLGCHSAVGVEKLADEAETRTKLIELLLTAQHSVRAMHPTVAWGDVLDMDFSVDRALYDRGLDIRSIYPHTTRRQREGLNYFRRLRELGCQFRTTVSVPGRVILIDDRIAVLLLRSRHDGGVVAREPNIVGFFEQLFEDTWDRALPVSEYDYDKDVRRELELLVLIELSSGRSDEAIARRLDISTRTLRRYITGLYERFGVETRFQLGVAAARAGILPGAPDLE